MNTSNIGDSSDSPKQTSLPPARPRVRSWPPAQPAVPTREAAQPEGADGSENATREGAGRDYEVGYGKPPKHTQFRKGQSGNPKGRPRGAKGLSTIARETMTEKMPVRAGGVEKKMPRIEALLFRMFELAMKGNMRAAAEIMKLYAAAVPNVSGSENAPSADELTATDLAMLAQLGWPVSGGTAADPLAPCMGGADTPVASDRAQPAAVPCDAPPASREAAEEQPAPECGTDWDRSLV
jgi:hypothetical protein